MSRVLRVLMPVFLMALAALSLTDRAAAQSRYTYYNMPAPGVILHGQVIDPVWQAPRVEQRRARRSRVATQGRSYERKVVQQRRLATRAKIKQRPAIHSRAAQRTRAAALRTAPRMQKATRVARLAEPALSVPDFESPRLSAPQRRVAPQAGGNIEARIDIRSQRMTVRVNGDVVHVWKVSTGRAGFVTPRGTYKPGRMHASYFSRKYYNSPMPYSIFFRGGYAIHGTNAVNRLGGPASHGCIRLATPNARALFQLVKAHGSGRTRIIIS